MSEGMALEDWAEEAWRGPKPYNHQRWLACYKNYRRKAERVEDALGRALNAGIDHVSDKAWAAVERRARETAEALADLRAIEQEA